MVPEEKTAEDSAVSASFGLIGRLKRRATYFLAFLVAVAGAYLVLSSWGDYSLTGATLGVSEEPKVFTVSASLSFPEKGFDIKDVTLEITLGEAEETFSGGTLLLDGLNMESFQGASVVLNGYEGHVAVADNSIVLNGEATSAIINNVVMNKGGAAVTVETTGLQFDSVGISGVSVKSFSLVSTGTVDVAGKGTFSVNNENVEMKSFNGMVDIDGSGMKVTGVTQALSIDGEPRVSID